MIPTTETLATLQSMLRKAGFNAAKPDPALAWRTFKEFALVPVDCASDGLLFETGVFKTTGAPQFHFSFTRQFTHDEEGEYSGMEQLGCAFLYAPDHELSQLKTSLWSFDSPSLDAYFSQVEALPEFRVPLARFTPISADISQEEV